MQPDDLPASPPSAAPNSAAPLTSSPAAAPADPSLVGAQRGLQILQVTLVITLIAALLSGVTRTYMMDQLLNHRDSSTVAMPMLSLVLGAWHLLFLGLGVAELVALQSLASAPEAARVSGLARSAFGLQIVELLLSLLATGLPYMQRDSLTGHQLTQLLQYVGGVSTVVRLLCTLMLVEVLLRLRRFAAAENPAVTENEGLVRAGLWGATFASIVVAYASTAVGFYLFGMGSMGQWATLAVRLPFALLFYGLMLWLVQATAATLNTSSAAAAATAATAAREAAPADQSAAGYRNLLLGGLWAVLGIGLTVVTYENAHQLGGRFVVAYGAIGAGIIQFIRGLTQLGRR